MTFHPPLNPYITGRPVSERGFFGREDILRDVERTLLSSGQNAIVLFGQRRIGKTSIVHQLKILLASSSFVPIYFDLQDKTRLPMWQVLYEMARATAAAVGRPMPNEADFRENTSALRQTFLPDLCSTLADGRRLVFLFDELDVLDPSDPQLAPDPLPKDAAATEFYPYLQRWMTEESQHGFIFVVGRKIEELSTNFLAAFRTAHPIQVSVLKREDAIQLIKWAEREGALTFDPGAVDRILELTNGHPYFTQLVSRVLFDRLYMAEPEGVPTAIHADVEAVLTEVIEACAHVFQWIWDSLPPAERIILSAIASRAGEGQVLSEEEVMGVLQGAGIRILVKELRTAPQTLVEWEILAGTGGGYAFSVELMRRWVAQAKPLESVRDELDRIIPQAEALYSAAVGDYRGKEYENAVAELKRALRLNPNHLSARLLLGTILREQGKLAEAVDEFNLAHSYSYYPETTRYELVHTLFQQGEMLEKAGEREKALAAYDKVLKLSPHEPLALERRDTIYVHLGDDCLKTGQFKEAFERYRMVQREDELKKLQARLASHAKAWINEQDQKNAADVFELMQAAWPDSEQTRILEQALEEWREIGKQYKAARAHMDGERWSDAKLTLAGIVARKPDYRDAAQLLATAINQERGKGKGRWPAWLYIVGIGMTILLMGASIWLGINYVSASGSLAAVTRTAETEQTQMAIAALTATATALTPAPTPTPDLTPPATPTPSPTPTLTPTPTPTWPSYPAPILLSPEDGTTFAVETRPDLTWERTGDLAPDEYYVVTISFSPWVDVDAIWQDIHTLKENTFTLPTYLYGLLDPSRRSLTWKVEIARIVEVAENGTPTWIPVSPSSETRTLLYVAPVLPAPSLRATPTPSR
jgi:tetratricopeptide (TPR) repeat protein